MSDPVKSCGTCAFASWKGQLTPTGRFKRDAVTRCRYEIKIPVLPASVSPHQRQRMMYDKIYTGPTDGERCACWASAQAQRSAA